MALLTISGETASGWEEVAHGAASLLHFELVTEACLAQWVTEEFGNRIYPRAWKAAATSVSRFVATEHHLSIAVEGAERLFDPLPLLMTVYIASPKLLRSGHLMIGAAPVRACCARQARAGASCLCVNRASDVPRRSGRVRSYSAPGESRRPPSRGSASPLLLERAAWRKNLPRRTPITFSSPRACNWRRHQAPAWSMATFSHPEPVVEMFANLLDFYRIAWDVEPRSFPSPAE